MKKIFSDTTVIAVAETIGFANGVVFKIIKERRLIKIVNPKNFPELGGNMIWVANHPDLLHCMYEVFLVPALLFPKSLLHPLDLTPWFMPDFDNFTHKLRWAWLRERAIPVVRQRRGGNGFREAREMLRVLRGKSAILVLFPEGGRTDSGSKFLYSESGTNRLRPLKKSAALAALATGASIWPIWLGEEGKPFQPKPKSLFSLPRFDAGPIVVKFGNVMQFNDFRSMSQSQLTRLLELTLLELADQE